jgi:TraG P-loop domain
MREYPKVLEPLLFYILHRADEVICDPRLSGVFKAFFIDEAWVFLRNPSTRAYILEALKTWRKHNAALVLSTQSLDELRKSEILDVIIETCPTKIFLARCGFRPSSSCRATKRASTSRPATRSTGSSTEPTTSATSTPPRRASAAT